MLLIRFNYISVVTLQVKGERKVEFYMFHNLYYVGIISVRYIQSRLGTIKLAQLVH